MKIDLYDLGNGGGGTGSVVNWSQIVTGGTQIATVTINGHATNVYSPEGGEGSEVEWNQTQTTGDKIAEVTIDGTTTDVYAPDSSKVSFNRTLSEGTKIGTITIDGTSTDVYAPEGGEGSEVEWNQTQTTGDKIAEVTIDGTTTDVYAPDSSKVSFTQTVSEGTKIGAITIDGTSTDIYAPQGGEGSEVEWDQVVTGGTKIAEVTIDGVSTDVYAPQGGEGGDSVEWNQIQDSGTKIAEVTINGVSTDVYAPQGGGSESESLPMVDLPETADNGEIFNRKTKYLFKFLSWDYYDNRQSYNINISDDNYESGVDVAKWFYNSTSPSIYFRIFTGTDGGFVFKAENVSTGDIISEAEIVNGVDGTFSYGSTPYTVNVTYTWTDKGLKIDLSRKNAYVEHINDVTEYRYKGTLCRYNSGAGEWGRWYWNGDIDKNNSLINPTISLIYTKIPESLNGRTLLSLSRFSSSTTGYRVNFVYNLTGETIDVYDYATDTLKNSIHIGDSLEISLSTNKMTAYFEDGRFSIICSSTAIQVREIIPTTTESGHYELLDYENQPLKVTPNYDAYRFPAWDENGRIIGMSDRQIYQRTLYYNTTGYNNNVDYLTAATGTLPQRLFFPTQSGTDGQILQSVGNGEPVWINKNAVTNGITFMTLTQEEYDEIEVKNPMTLYIIYEEDV